jgi:cytochrome c2
METLPKGMFPLPETILDWKRFLDSFLSNKGKKVPGTELSRKGCSPDRDRYLTGSDSLMLEIP